jgi:hypothetical protein
MSDEPLLFPELPEAVAPLYLYADEHMLEPCWRCDGTGKERPPEWWSRARVELYWDPTCRKCAGAGARLVFVGPVRDV